MTTLAVEGWNVAVPAARTKLVEGQWVPAGGVKLEVSFWLQDEAPTVEAVAGAL